MRVHLESRASVRILTTASCATDTSQLRYGRSPSSSGVVGQIRVSICRALPRCEMQERAVPTKLTSDWALVRRSGRYNTTRSLVACYDSRRHLPRHSRWQGVAPLRSRPLVRSTMYVKQTAAFWPRRVGDQQHYRCGTVVLVGREILALPATTWHTRVPSGAQWYPTMRN